jgi:SAM-dependent methyltransferase
MQRSFSHVRPRYLFDRVMLSEKLRPNDPWLTSQATNIIDKIIAADDIGVEFGSGRSTLWLAKRLAHLTSVESNQEWFAKISSEISRSNLNKKINYHLIQDHKQYADIALDFEDNSLDFCLVDGINRDECAINIIDKLKPGGILVIDNINLYIPQIRPRSPNSRTMTDGHHSQNWEIFSIKTRLWRRIWTSNGVFDTCIFLKCI